MPNTERDNVFDQLTNPDSELVKNALTRTCRICHVKPGYHCTNLTDNRPLPGGRLVHHDRTST